MILLLDFIFAWSLIVFDLIFFTKTTNSSSAATPAPEEPRAVEKPRGRTYYGRKAKILKTAPDVSLRRALFPPGT